MREDRYDHGSAILIVDPVMKQGLCNYCWWRGPIRDHKAQAARDLDEHVATAAHRECLAAAMARKGD